MTGSGIPIAQAAMRAKKNYLAMRNMVLRGAVIGWQDERGRWLVDARDLDRYLAEPPKATARERQELAVNA